MYIQVDKNFTLFIDRDGVVNKEKKEDYILHWNEFVFYEGVLEAFKIFNNCFGKIIMVTNQRGVGKGKMSLEDLENIHSNMLQTIKDAAGRVDKIYFCTDINNDSINRKPNAGMAFKAKYEFEDIDFSKAFMVGNKLSDMGFGRNAGIKTVYLDTTNPEVEQNHPLIDYRYNNLIDFAKSLQF
jgi:histidinol-phosphate phosphatase family protein